MPTPVARPALRQLWASVRLMLVLTIVLGLAYPLVLTGIAQLAFRNTADGSLVRSDDVLVGSSLIGQSFDARPEYFQSRPSAAGDGYDALSSGASNLGPESDTLVHAIEGRRNAAAELDGGSPANVAPDALQASGSGLDPHISPQYAAQQVDRVARERGLDPAQVDALVERYTTGRVLGFLGEPRVNVLELNLALDRASNEGQ